MAASIASSWRSFWHTMTSNDRHATHDSPYRSGGHLPLGQSRHSPLTAVTSAASESRTDLSADESGFVPSGSRPLSPSSPYTPGMRSTMQRKSSQPDTSYAANGMGDVPMQNFQEGLPPPPPVPHTWKRIDRWLEDNYEELEENMGEGCTQNDVNELEHELDCSLPQDVRESLQIHDGQERGGRPSGVIFGCMLLDCEEIVQEWKQWSRTNEEYLREQYTTHITHQPPVKALAGSSTQARSASPASSAGSSWRAELLARQDSQPPNAVQKAYVHNAWIPLARDWGGNNICVDLAPGPAGKWGQIILMGRDYDCKYVIARSWGAFLANVADDMSSNKWFIDEDTQELKLREFPKQNVLPAYMDILRWRSDQKYGRRPPQKMKRPAPPLKINSQVKNEFASLNGFSPYASPKAAGGDRGRSPPSAAYRNPNAPSPLSRVAEESNTGSDPNSPSVQKVDRLVSIDSPIIGSNLSIDTDDAQKPANYADLASPTAATSEKDGLLKTATENVTGAENEMKTVQI